MQWDGKEDRRAILLGRRQSDRSKDCPFHSLHQDRIETHAKAIEGLICDMKKRPSLKMIILMFSIMTSILGISYFAIDRYVQTATTTAVGLLKEHIKKSTQQMEKTNEALHRLEISNRVILYRLDRLDKSPGPSGTKGALKPEI